MNIDIHCHFAAKDFTEKARKIPGFCAPTITRDEDGTEILIRYDRRVPFLDSELSLLTSMEERFSLMNEYGDYFPVISPPTFFFFYKEPPEVGAELAMMLNEGLAKAMQDYPGRIACMAAIPMQDARLAVKELERVRKDLKMCAVYIGSNINGHGLDAIEFWPFYEAAEALEMPIFIHPMSSDLAGADRMKEYFLNNLIGNPLDTTLAAARLIFGGVMERFPRLKICLAHGGGYLAWAIGRMNRGYKVHSACQRLLNSSPDELIRRFYVDTIVHSPQALSYLISLFGADHVLIGTDYPFKIGDHDPISLVNAIPGLTEENMEKILFGNAIRLLSLKEIAS